MIRFFAIPLFLMGLLYTSAASQTSDSGTKPISEIKLDHIIVTVQNIDKAAETYSTLGFTIKEGRLHANGLLNKHIKFKDGSSVELMTVKGNAKDDIARAYQEFLKNQEGGIYVAINAPFDLVMEKADELGLSYQTSFGDPFSYITFENADLANVFFISYGKSFTDPDSILTHKNKVTGIKGIWMESSPLFVELIINLGAELKGMLSTPDGKQNPVYRLNHYDFIVDESISKKPKILGIQFDSENSPNLNWLPPSQNHGIWITFR